MGWCEPRRCTEGGVVVTPGTAGFWAEDNRAVSWWGKGRHDSAIGSMSMHASIGATSSRMNRAHSTMSIAEGKLLGSRVEPYIVEYGARGALQQSDSRQTMPGAQQADKATTQGMEDKCAAGKDGAAVEYTAAQLVAEVASGKHCTPQSWRCCRRSESLALASQCVGTAAGSLAAVDSALLVSVSGARLASGCAWCRSGGCMLWCSRWDNRRSATRSGSCQA
jgi:hypothetical protein